MVKKYQNQDNIVVSVFMLTYLHSKYIRQAINGVLIQECNFPIELIIADDKSPDDTEDIVNEFLENHPKKHLVKYTRHKENKGMHGNFQWMTDQARGKYIAQCEGDDYWTDPHKLQKQVDFLEENPDYGMVYTKARVYEEKTQKFWNLSVGSKINKKGDVLYKNPIPSLTTLYRSDLNQSYLMENNDMPDNWLMGDFPRWIWFDYNSKIHFLNETTAVYRKLENSASNFVDIKKRMAFNYNTIEIQTFFGKKYLSATKYSKLRNHILSNYYYTALHIDPADSLIYYNEIKETKELKLFTTIKLFVLEKFKFKHIYLYLIGLRANISQKRSFTG